MNTFQVWTEGYKATGESSKATYHGNFDGETFRDAVIAFRDSIKRPNKKACVHIDTMTFWGCRFFDNHDDAIKSFG